MDRTMDAEYARLSLLSGLFASAADTAIGKPHFIHVVRANAWNLTWELLTTWKAEAVAMGVAAELLEPPPELEALMPVLVETGIELQAVVDEHLSRERGSAG